MRKYRIDIIDRYLDVSPLNLQPFRSQTYRYQIDYFLTIHNSWLDVNNGICACAGRKESGRVGQERVYGVGRTKNR